jgi:hypothetical protein
MDVVVILSVTKDLDVTGSGRSGITGATAKTALSKMRCSRIVV